MDQRWTARLYRRFVHKYFGNDLLFELQKIARQEAIDYIRAHMGGAMMFRDRFEQLAWAVRNAPGEGLVLEFGVEKGASLRTLAAGTSRIVHGFDSFEGLPENWAGTYELKSKFHMKGRLPKTAPNARLHVGWFDDTLPKFLAETSEPVALAHLDADIYSSTKTALALLTPRIRSGSLLVFDEYFNYPAWKAHEYKAFQEWIADTGYTYSYVGFSTEKGHVAVRIG